MDTPFNFKAHENARIVYVRAADASELPDDLEIDNVDEIYSVHAPDGEPLAFVRGRALAFALARQNDFSPVTVH